MEKQDTPSKGWSRSSLLPAALVFAAVMSAGYLLKGARLKKFLNLRGSHEVRESGYTFISPLLECEKDQSFDAMIRPFRGALARWVDQKRKAGTITGAAVYFRDLNDGPWSGINEQEKFQPASLLKVPLAIAVYKAAESDPKLLQTKIRFKTVAERIDDRQPTILPSQQIELGKEYSLEELVEAMLRYSDNQALLLVYQNTPKGQLRDLYKVLGVETDVLTRVTGTMSVKSFSTFYRILFNASYLNRESSEKILRILNSAEYKKALVGGVPAGIKVAHKFGEGGAMGGERQLQDCGIVYYPGNPYLLCVMAKGGSIESLEGFIRDVSAFVYKRVDADVSFSSHKAAL